jgi:hypothetical protein
MCHYITLVVDGIAEDAVRSYMLEQGRDASPVENASIRAILKPSEMQYLTVRRPKFCDCGTGLLRDQKRPPDNNAAETTKLKRKGWSQAKIERAISQREAAAEREQSAPDGPDFWSALLGGLLFNPEVRSAGLLLHSYQASVVTEEIPAKRKELEVNNLNKALLDFEEDHLIIFSKAVR